MTDVLKNYRLKGSGREIQMPSGAEIIAVVRDGAHVRLRVIQDAANTVVTRTVDTFRTGDEVPAGAVHLDTAMLAGGALVSLFDLGETAIERRDENVKG